MSTSHRFIAGSTRSSRRAFTLVEMLVVLGIIGVLIALLLPAVMYAQRTARNAALALEIKNLDTALNTYKQQRGEFPPCFGDYNSSGNLVYSTAARTSSVVERHLQRCYPKFIDNPMNSNDFKDQFYTAAMNVDQAEALVLWLSLISTNPANPFETTATRSGYYEFKQSQLVDNGDSDGIPIYVSPYTREQPFIYVENRNYTSFMRQNCYARALLPNGNNAQTLPYGSAPTAPMNPTSFQILTAGQDGDWGDLPAPASNMYPAKVFPTDLGGYYKPGDKDNLTNFSGGKTLGDSRPQ
ncbi:type II secretion system protein [Anatilimnocola floriformis]|uniref:type II secretion system protein n=1 Tax=Anatilimnocola floriformis TaxID=2948575 RepID=UPI0020C407C4|nr:type II secretion system protein [Anatilimnocola floriformis]